MKSTQKPIDRSQLKDIRNVVMTAIPITIQTIRGAAAIMSDRK